MRTSSCCLSRARLDKELTDSNLYLNTQVRDESILVAREPGALWFKQMKVFRLTKMTEELGCGGSFGKQH